MPATTSLWPSLRLAASRRCMRQTSQAPVRLYSQRSASNIWSQNLRATAARRLPLRTCHEIFVRHDSTRVAGFEGKNATGTEETEEEKLKRKMPNLRAEGHENPQDVPRPEANERGEVPAYELTFTCKPCKTRSAHRISKHGYHNGTVLITCPHCKNRHVISDHLKIFNDKSKTFEQILKEKEELLKRGVLDPEGDFEMWDDGSRTVRQKDAEGIPQAGQTPAT